MEISNDMIKAQFLAIKLAGEANNGDRQAAETVVKCLENRELPFKLEDARNYDSSYNVFVGTLNQFGG